MKWTPEEIKAFRQSLGLYQKDFAELLGVTRVYVGLMERGEKIPSKTMRALLTCLDEKEKGKETKRSGKRNL